MEVKGITAGVNAWALLRDNDPGDGELYLAVVDDPKKRKKLGTKTKAAKNKNGAAVDKLADAEVVQTNGVKEGKAKLKETTPAAAVDFAFAVDDDVLPKKRKKRGTKTKAKKKNGDGAGDEQANGGRKEGGQTKLRETAAPAAMADGKVQIANGRKEHRQKQKKTPAVAPSKGAGISGRGVDGGYECDGHVTAGGAGRCRVVAGRICKAAVAVAFLAFWCRLASAPHVTVGRIV